MNTFNEYQSAAIRTPVCADARDINLPVLGLQEESGKIASLLPPTASGKLALTSEQLAEVRMRCADILWYLAVLCNAAGLEMQDVADQSLAQL